MNNTLIKGLRLLEVLTRRGRPLGITELATACDMPKSGIHRLLQALVDEGYVVKQPTGFYSASIKLWELGSSALYGFDLRRHADPVMEALMEETGMTVHLSVLDQREVVYVHKVDSPHPVRAYTQIGGRAPAHCVATGKAMMAFKSPHWLSLAVQSLMPATPRTIVDTGMFKAEMKRIRRRGYAVNRGEWRLHVNGLAAPIIDGSSAVIAAIGISGDERDLRLRTLISMAQPVLRAAQVLSSELSNAAPHASLQSVTRRWTSV